ncbi:MAG: pyruvate kinase alpha/beta domain-containing protein, partial [Candidatus Bathyarchaeia archaeon]
MKALEKSITYFESPGEENTDMVLALAKKRAEELGIKDIVVASTRGYTGVKASEIFRGYNLVVVTHHTGFRELGQQELTEENRRRIEANGGKIYTGTHVFMNVERAIRSKFGTAYPAEIMAQTLRLFCEGMKVAVEIAAMAADAGLIPVNREVISIAGTGRGADTAIVLQPANSSRIFDMVIKEIIAKPRG